MSKKKDLEDFDRFMDWLKDNPDVRGWLAEMFDNEETNNSHTFDPMKDGNAKRPTPRQRLAMTKLVLRIGNEPRDGVVGGNLPEHLINQRRK